MGECLDSVAEWLRRQTRNLLGLPAQVRILPLSLFVVAWILEQFPAILAVYRVIDSTGEY